MTQPSQPQPECATDMSKCEWQEVYYGYKCVKCGTFVPFGSEPWMPLDNDGDDDPTYIGSTTWNGWKVDLHYGDDDE